MIKCKHKILYYQRSKLLTGTYTVGFWISVADDSISELESTIWSWMSPDSMTC